MDCQEADLAMMQYMEKNILPQAANELARHVLSCETCREQFLALDEAMEFVESPEAEEAPEGFTAKVMEKVRLLPAHTGSLKTNERILSKNTRILMGISAIIFGALLLVAGTAMDTVTQFLGSISDSIVEFFTAISTQSAGMPTLLNVFTLFLILVIGALLFVLHRGEQINTATEGH